MYEFTDFISILAYASYLISVILEFKKKKGKSKMADPGWRAKCFYSTSSDVITDKKLYQFVEHVKDYLINVNLFRSA